MMTEPWDTDPAATMPEAHVAYILGLIDGLLPGRAFRMVEVGGGASSLRWLHEFRWRPGDAPAAVVVLETDPGVSDWLFAHHVSVHHATRAAELISKAVDLAPDILLIDSAARDADGVEIRPAIMAAAHAIVRPGGFVLLHDSEAWSEWRNDELRLVRTVRALTSKNDKGWVEMDVCRRDP